MKKLLLVVAGILCLAGSVSARSLQLRRGETGLWSDPTMWYDKNDTTQHYAPQPGDSLELTAFWDISLSLDGDVSMPFTMTTSARADKVLSFHGDGYVLESSGDDIVKNPFYLYSPNNHVFQYLRAAGSGTAFRFDDPEITVSNATGVSYFDFHSGTFNFYDPNESVNDGPINLFCATNTVKVVFGKDATARLCSTVLGANGTESLGDAGLCFEGGSHYLKEILWKPIYAAPHEMSLSVEGGAHLTTDKVDLQNQAPNATGAVGGEVIRAVLDLSDGARLDVGADGLSAKPTTKYLVPEVRLDHATLASDGTANLGFENGNDGTNRFVAVDSTIAWTNGAFSCGYFASSTAKVTAFGAFTNTTFVAKTFNFYTGAKYLFKDCHVEATTQGSSNFGNRGTHTPDAAVVFDHCTVTNAAFKSYPAGLTGVMRFTGGTQADLWDLYLTGAADVRIDGGSRVDCQINSGNRIIGGGDVFSTLTVSNAVFTSTKANWFLGMNKVDAGVDGGCGILRVQDGAEVSFGGKDDTGMMLYVGYVGRGRLEVSGGVLWARRIHVGNQPKGYGSDEHSVFRMTGGEVHTYAGEDYAVVAFGAGADHAADCILDGGKLYAMRVMGAGNAATSFSADGGTLVVSRDVTGSGYFLLSGFDTAELGAKGLTVDSQYKAKMTQSMADKDGERGLFRKVGPKDLQFAPTTWTVSETRVEEGALVVMPATLAMETALAVTNGATLSLAGDCTALTVDSLDLNDATLLLDAGDRIVVTGAAEIRNLRLSFTTAPTGALTNELLVVTEPLSAASVDALRSAASAVPVPAGMAGRAVVETSGGVTTVKLTVQGDAAPLTEETTWKGAAGDLWNDGENGWTDGVPTADTKAVFAAEGSREVTVPAGAKAGALAFGDGFTLSGETLAMPTARGALTIETTAGETEIAAPLDLADEAKVTTAAGTALTLSGDVTHGGILKDGTGKLVLGGVNQFEYGLEFGAGTTEIAGKDALGVVPGFIARDIELANNALRFRTADGSETVTKRGICVTTPGTYQSAVLCVDTPATVGNLRATQGAILKRGLAPLTVEVSGDYTLLSKAASKSSYCQRVIRAFPGDDGSTPENPGTSGEDFFTGFSVTEGELRFTAAPGVTLPTVSMTADAVSIGIHTTNVTMRSIFTLDGVRFSATGCDFYANGFNDGNHYITSGETYTLDPELLCNEVRLVNGAVLDVWKFYENNYGSGQYMRPSVFMTNATLRAKSELWFSNARSAKANVHLNAKSTYRVSDSALEGPLALSGGVDGDFANTYLGPIDHTAAGTMKFSNTGFGTLLFRDGSVFRVSTFDLSAFDTRYTLTFAFDGAEWQYGAGDYTFSPALPAGMSEFFAFESRGKGLILKPAEGTTFTADYPIGGTGGVVVDGPGTVKFNADMLAFTGTAVVRQGTLDAGGQAVAVRIEPGEAVPTLKDCAAKGKIQVDMGGAVCEKGATFAVARISGSTPLRFKAVNFADPELYGYFTVQDGLVTMTVGDKPGLAIIVR